MTGTRLDKITDPNDLIGMVLTENEKKNVSLQDVANVLEKLTGDSLGYGYLAERLFGQVKWGEQAFYD